MRNKYKIKVWVLLAFLLCVLANACTTFITNLCLIIITTPHYQGSAIEDLILSWCLGPCVLCQEAREAGIKAPPFTVPLTMVGADAKPSAAPAAQEMGRDKEVVAEVKAVEPKTDAPAEVKAKVDDAAKPPAAP